MGRKTEGATENSAIPFSGLDWIRRIRRDLAKRYTSSYQTSDAPSVCDTRSKRIG